FQHLLPFVRPELLDAILLGSLAILLACAALLLRLLGPGPLAGRVALDLRVLERSVALRLRRLRRPVPGASDQIGQGHAGARQRQQETQAPREVRLLDRHVLPLRDSALGRQSHRESKNSSAPVRSPFPTIGGTVSLRAPPPTLNRPGQRIPRVDLLEEDLMEICILTFAGSHAAQNILSEVLDAQEDRTDWLHEVGIVSRAVVGRVRVSATFPDGNRRRSTKAISRTRWRIWARTPATTCRRWPGRSGR